MNKNTEHLNVWFHVGHDDRSYTTPCKRYIDTVSALSDTFKEDSMVDKTDENGEPLPDSEWKLLDRVGNIILQGREEIEAETGVIDWDALYDCDIVCNITECSDDEYKLILDAAEREEYVDEDVLSYACQRLGKLLATSIKVYPSNMEVFTQEYCVHLERDNFSVYTENEEDEVRELLEDKGFISESIDRIIDKMKMHQWFGDEEEDEK